MFITSYSIPKPPSVTWQTATARDALLFLNQANQKNISVKFVNPQAPGNRFWFSIGSPMRSLNGIAKPREVYLCAIRKYLTYIPVPLYQNDTGRLRKVGSRHLRWRIAMICQFNLGSLNGKNLIVYLTHILNRWIPVQKSCKDSKNTNCAQK